MGNALTMLMAAVAFGVIAIFAAVQLGTGDYSTPAAIGVLIVIAGAAFVFGRKRPFEAVVLLATISGYMLLGRGLAYQRIGTVFFAGEVVLAFCLLSYLVRLYQGKFPLFPRSPAAIPLFALGIYSLIHLVFDYQVYGLMALRDSCVIYYTLFFFVSYQLGRIEGVADFLSRGLLVVSPFVLAVSIVHVFAPGVVMAAQGIRLAGIPVFLPHTDATTSAVFGLFAWLYFKSQHAMTGRFAFLIAAVLILAYLFIQARGATYIAIGALLFFLFLARQWRFFIAGVPAMILAGSILLLVFHSADPKTGRLPVMKEQLAAIATLGSTGTQSSQTARWRLEWWSKITKDVMDTNPLFGLGFGADIYSDFHRQFFRTAVVDDEKARIRGAHNAFFTILGRGGIIGALLFSWVVLSQLLYFWRAAQAAARGIMPARYLFFWGFAISGFTITFLQYTWEAPYSAIPFWTCFGMACASLDKQLAEEAAPQDEVVEEPKVVIPGRLVPAR